MPEYCKAYQLKELRKFPGWTERAGVSQPGEAAEEPNTSRQKSPDLNDDSVVFLREDMTVSRSGFGSDDVIFDAVTQEWESFCREALRFSVPDWEAEAADVREKLASMKEKERKAETQGGEP